MTTAQGLAAQWDRYRRALAANEPGAFSWVALGYRIIATATYLREQMGYDQPIPLDRSKDYLRERAGLDVRKDFRVLETVRGGEPVFVVLTPGGMKLSEHATEEEAQEIAAIVKGATVKETDRSNEPLYVVVNHSGAPLSEHETKEQAEKMCAVLHQFFPSLVACAGNMWYGGLRGKRRARNYRTCKREFIPESSIPQVWDIDPFSLPHPHAKENWYRKPRAIVEGNIVSIVHKRRTVPFKVCMTEQTAEIVAARINQKELPVVSLEVSGAEEKDGMAESLSDD
jgi:hypothetical protein